MARLNPDTVQEGHPHSAFSPVNRVTALFDSYAEVRAAIADLQKAGFSHSSIEVFVGEEGAKNLDLSGEEHGGRIKLLRQWEWIAADEAEINNGYDLALQEGGIILVVLTDGAETSKQAAFAALGRHGARSVYFWGRWVIERSRVPEHPAKHGTTGIRPSGDHD